MRTIAILVTAALFAAAPVSAVAQESEPFEPAFTAEDDIDCAIFVASIMAELGIEMTPENRVGLTSAFTYFIGRYEAQRGLGLTEAFVERFSIYQQRNPAEIEQTCSVRMRAFSVRLQESQSAAARLSPPPAPSQE